MPYTEKSFVVMGETIDHSKQLVELGGKFNTNLRIGEGWIFAKVREPSVRHYIESGEVKPFVYSKEQQNMYKKNGNGTMATTPENPQILNVKLRNMFKTFRNAFDPESEYNGQSIIDVIDQLEARYVKE